MSYEYSVEAHVAAHQAFLDLIADGAGSAMITIETDASVVLAEIILADPPGTVDPLTGQATLDVALQEDAALATGTAAFARIRDGDGDVHLSLPCQTGTTALPGWCRLNSLSIVEGAPVEVLSAVIG